MEFDGLNLNMGNLFLLSDARTRSISPENDTGEYVSKPDGVYKSHQRFSLYRWHKKKCLKLS